MMNREERINLYENALEEYKQGHNAETDRMLNCLQEDIDPDGADDRDILMYVYITKAELLVTVKSNVKEEVIAYLDQALEILNELEDDAAYTNGYVYFCEAASKVFADYQEYKLSQQYALEVCRAYELECCDLSDYLVAIHNLTYCYYMQRDLIRCREYLSEGLNLIQEHDLEETPIASLFLNMNMLLADEDGNHPSVDLACEWLRDCTAISEANYFSMVNAVQLIVTEKSRVRNMITDIHRIMEMLETYIRGNRNEYHVMNFLITKAYVMVYEKNYSLARNLIIRTLEIEEETHFRHEVLINLFMFSPEYLTPVLSADEHRMILLRLIHGNPYRLQMVLQTSDEMALLRNISLISDFFKMIMTRIYMNKIQVMNDDLVELIVNCKNIYADVLAIRKRIMTRNSELRKAYDEQDVYEELNELHRRIIRDRMGAFFSHPVDKKLIQEAEQERHDRELYLLEEIPQDTFHWMSCQEILGQLPNNSMYVDYTEIPLTEDLNPQFMDIYYAVTAIYHVNGRYEIQRFPCISLIGLRYQFELLERLMRDRYGKGVIFDLGRRMHGDTKLLYSMYKELLEKPIRYAEGLGLHPDTIIVSGDVELSSFSFESLINGQGKYLVECYDIIQVNSLRNFPGYTHIEDQDRKQAVVIGNPSFTLDPSIDRTSIHEKYLIQIPLSKIEAQAVADALGTTPYLREQSSKSLLMENDCRILHIASHGEHLNADFASEMRKDGIFGDVTNPMSTSCLFLSGANDWIVRNHVDEKYDTGILNGEELYTYHLPNLKMVVLSTCFSGSGDINYSVGLLGMRTALMALEPEVIITSLWEADDFASAVFMTRFYDGLPSMSVSESFRHAKLCLMKITLGELQSEGWFGEQRIRRLGLVAEDMRKIAKQPPETRLFEKPYYWAGFHILLHKVY